MHLHLRLGRITGIEIDALPKTMGRDDINQLPVVFNGRIEGMLSRSRIVQVLQTRAELSM